MEEWRKSSYSDDGEGNCVEVSWAGIHPLARDSKNPNGERLAFSNEAWASFLTTVRQRLS